jgi:hypothetical protein
MTPRLRWFSTYDKNGVELGEVVLQIWDEEYEMWEDINHVRVPESKADLYQTKEDRY